MSGSLYKGTVQDGSRAQSLAKQRERSAAAFERARRDMTHGAKGLVDVNDRFQSQDTRAETHFKQSTVGLVSAEEYKRRRLEAEEAMRQQDKERKRLAAKAKKKLAKKRKQKLLALSFAVDGDDEEDGGDDDGDAGSAGASLSSLTKDKKKKKKKKSQSKTMDNDDAVDNDDSGGEDGAGHRKKRARHAAGDASVSANDDGDGDGDGDDDGDGDEEAKSAANDEALLPVPKKITKDTTVDTHFLPDKHRDAEEALLRQQLADEWKRKQEVIKKQLIKITYSYWDGTGHRRTIKVHKGMTIGQFLEQARHQLVDEFHELRGMTGDGLMYVKEDLIIPSHLSFYDLILSKARGKTGPLFRFDAREDVRLVVDARVEVDESHAGKVITRGWYESNKHLYPSSNWVIYSPGMSFDKYTR